jgi:cytidylate kinase
MAEPAPVITIDGPSGSGKGTVARRVADHLGWHLLDSGALYRLLGLAAVQRDIDLKDDIEIINLAINIKVKFKDDRVWLDGADVTDRIRTEAAGSSASKVAAIPAVRAALLQWQRDYARPPGLVADGRDMGTVVFPHARVKVFLTASAEERARRRYNQLIEKGLPANLAALTHEIEARDARDRGRTASPLVPAPDALEIDSTSMSIDEVVQEVLVAAREARLLAE